MKTIKLTKLATVPTETLDDLYHTWIDSYTPKTDKIATHFNNFGIAHDAIVRGETGKFLLDVRVGKYNALLLDPKDLTEDEIYDVLELYRNWFEYLNNVRILADDVEYDEFKLEFTYEGNTETITTTFEPRKSCYVDGCEFDELVFKYQGLDDDLDFYIDNLYRHIVASLIPAIKIRYGVNLEYYPTKDVYSEPCFKLC